MGAGTRSTQANARADSRTAASTGLPRWLRPAGDGVLIAVHLQPGARRTAIAGEHGDRLKIAVQVPPVDGRANEALVEWIAQRLQLPRHRASLASGHRGRDKTVLVSGIDAESVRQRLARE